MTFAPPHPAATRTAHRVDTPRASPSATGAVFLSVARLNHRTPGCAFVSWQCPRPRSRHSPPHSYRCLSVPCVVEGHRATVGPRPLRRQGVPQVCDPRAPCRARTKDSRRSANAVRLQVPGFSTGIPMPHDDMRLCVCACSLTISRGETTDFRVRNDRTRRKLRVFLSFGTTKSKISAPAAGYRGAPPP